MKSEPLSNLGFVCPTHAPKTGQYKDHKPQDFVGKYVKLPFRGQAPDGEERVEHMWVKVASVEKDVCVGTLNNDPLLEMDFRCGSIVKFPTVQIEAVFSDA